MTQVKASTGMQGNLMAKKLRQPKSHKVRQVRLPWGRVAFTRDPGEASLFAQEFMTSNLLARHFDGDGVLIGEHDLGSGVVTSNGVLALAYDWQWPSASATIALNTLRIANNHASGTGSTAAAISDIKLQTPSGQGGQTMVAGVQTVPAAASLASGTYPKYQSVATISYTGSETVSEWGLFGNLGAIGGTALSSATGSPLTGGSATTGVVTGTPLTASANGVQGQSLTLLENTNGTRVSWCLCLNNSTSTVTTNAWYKTADSTGGTAPTATDTMVFRPIMFDHRIFTGIGVGNGDSIQFTYQLSVQDGN